ncbi:MAG: flavodoxin [Bacteroidales bacterium]|nr:flavodoxin [Bacteroidales bacterium]MBD5327877.1 flavodoxin [Bacteroides sp.]MDE6222194.1 flavodoxin [Muribaculaceae bacterium]
MKKFGIFYGSQTGTTADIAARIAKKLGVDAADVHNVATAAPSAVGDYENLIFATSTWGSGDVEVDWLDFLDALKAMDLRGHRVALVGVGDETMADTFCSGVGIIYEKLKNSGAYFIGSYPADVYKFNHSDAIVDGQPVGLLLDETNHADLTDGRIDGWLLNVGQY